MEVKPSIGQQTQDAAEQWVQQTLDRELGQPATHLEMARLMVGAAILLNAIARVAKMDRKAAASA